MRDWVKIYGHQVPLDVPIGDDGIVTDVVVLSRVVYPATNADALLINATNNTTAIVQEGMFSAAKQVTAGRWGMV